MNSPRNFSRRSLFRTTGALAIAGAFATAGTGITAPRAAAANGPGPVLGQVLDYAAGVPSARSIKDGGFLGAVRYVSERRPGADWMLGKPVSVTETTNLAALGLETASVYQFGRAETADWKQGALGAATHAPKAIALHRSAGGPTGRPIYIAMDDNPTRAQYDSLIAPYLRAFEALLKASGYSAGIYGNYNVIDWAIADGIGSYFWMHDWGSGGKIHPRTTIHQLPQNKQQTIGGVVCDINNVYARDWGQWKPGVASGAGQGAQNNQSNGNNQARPQGQQPGQPGPSPAIPGSSNAIPSAAELQKLSSDPALQQSARTLQELLKLAQDNAHLAKQFGL